MSTIGIHPEDFVRIDNRKIELAKEITAFKDGKEKTITKSIPDMEKEDATNLRVYTYYHNIISSYEDELKALNGSTLTSPLVESDFTDRVNLTGRLYDVTYAESDIIRISQFDGSPTTTATTHEKWCLLEHTEVKSRLISGLTTSSGSGTTASSIVNGAVGATINVALTSAPALANKEVVIYGGGISVIAKVNSVSTVNASCSLPAYTSQGACIVNGGTWIAASYSMNITFITSFSGTIPSGASVIGAWTGFSESNRTTKTATYQTILNFYLSKLDNALTIQLTKLNEQKTAIQNNTEKDDSEISKIDAKVLAYTNYKATKLINNAGLATLTAINTERQTQIDSRIATVNTNKSKQYDKRYFWAVERAGAQGTMIQLKALNNSITTLTNMITKRETRLAVLKEEGI